MLTYKESGVDIDKANRFVDWIKKRVPGIGFFSGMYNLNDKQYLVATTDGVGTKLKIAQLFNRHTTVGIDLVAMNVNDIITCGAKPIFFLDYIAIGKINLSIMKQIMEGIIKGCKQAKCKLLGGETAEMPGVYENDEYDLAGFSCGIVDKDKIITGKNVVSGDEIIGLYSSGLHSNGYSLIRKIFSPQELKKLLPLGILEPTKIYVNQILRLLQQFKPNKEIKAIVNITGGGFYDNIVRVMNKNTKAVIYKDSWKPQKIFNIIQQQGKVPVKEMYRVFNMGIGMVLIVSPTVTKRVLNFINSQGIVIGKIIDSNTSKPEVVIV